jgi:retron-type reverse transcriptase
MASKLLALEADWRFWGLYVHICKRESLRAAYAMAKSNEGAPGSDGVTFEAIEDQGVESFLEQIRGELIERSYVPLRARKKEIPKEGSNKVRTLSIPCIRDRVVQGALKLIVRRDPTIWPKTLANQQWEEPVSEAKPFDISKQLVWDAYQRVKANRGTAGVDGESLTMFEQDLKGNLYKIWNRMSSGSY